MYKRVENTVFLALYLVSSFVLSIFATEIKNHLPME